MRIYIYIYTHTCDSVDLSGVVVVQLHTTHLTNQRAAL